MADLDEQYSMDVPEEDIAAAMSQPESPAKIVSHEAVPVLPKDTPAKEVHAEDVAPAPAKPAPPKKQPSLKEKVPALSASRQNSGQREAVAQPANGRLSELILPDIPHKASPVKQASQGRSGKSTPSKDAARPTSNGALPPISKSKIPSASPSRVQRPSPGRSRIPQASSPKSEGANVSPARDMSPGGGSWNLYNKDAAKPRNQIAITGPSDEERQKRRQWAIEKRRREEAKARAEAERQALEDARRREADEAKLEARRASIRERIQKQHEIAAKLATERAAAEERARAEMDKFIRGKPLYEKLMEDYEANRKQEEQDKKKQYDEEVAKMKNVRPHQIMTGEVVVKPSAPRQPPAKEPRDQSAGRARKPSAGRDKLLANANAILGGDGFDDDTEPGAVKALAVKPQRRERRKPSAREPEPPLLLYSRNPRPLLVERAVSPFVFNSEQQPVNVPDQAVFWKAEAPQVLALQLPVPQALPSVKERVESPNAIDEIEMGDDVLMGADDDNIMEQEVVAAGAAELLEQRSEEGAVTAEVKQEEEEAEVVEVQQEPEVKLEEEEVAEPGVEELQQEEEGVVEQQEQEDAAPVAAEQEEAQAESQPEATELAAEAEEQEEAAVAGEEAEAEAAAEIAQAEEEVAEPSEEVEAEVAAAAAAAAGDETFLTTDEPAPEDAVKESEGAEEEDAGVEAPQGDALETAATQEAELEAPEGGAELGTEEPAAAAGAEEAEEGAGAEEAEEGAEGKAEAAEGTAGGEEDEHRDEKGLAH